MPTNPPGLVDGHHVVVPHVAGMLRPETVDAVCDQVHAARFVPLPADDPTAYAALICQLWAAGEGFVIVEQDVVPPPGAIRALLACPRKWCGHLLPCGDRGLPATLGLAGFSTDLLHKAPRAAERALRAPGSPGGYVGWSGVDSALRHQLGPWRRHWHEHGPAALHLHDYGADVI